VETVAGDCSKAEAAEQAVIEELRQIGNEALPSGAERAVPNATATRRHEQPALQGNGKKSLVAYAVRENRGQRTGLAWSWPTGQTVSPIGSGESPELFPAVAPGDD